MKLCLMGKCTNDTIILSKLKLSVYVKHITLAALQSNVCERRLRTDYYRKMNTISKVTSNKVMTTDLYAL